MADYYIPKNDKGFNMSFTVQDSAGAAYNLTGYTVTLKVWKTNMPSVTVVSAACTIDDAATGKCHYLVQASNFAYAGDYLMELELTKEGVVESTRQYSLEVTESP